MYQSTHPLFLASKKFFPVCSPLHNQPHDDLVNVCLEISREACTHPLSDLTVQSFINDDDFNVRRQVPQFSWNLLLIYCSTLTTFLANIIFETPFGEKPVMSGSDRCM